MLGTGLQVTLQQLIPSEKVRVKKTSHISHQVPQLYQFVGRGRGYWTCKRYNQRCCLGYRVRKLIAIDDLGLKGCKTQQKVLQKYSDLSALTESQY